MVPARRGPVWLAALALALAGAAKGGAAEEPWQRVLKGDDARKAAALQEQIGKLSSDGKFADAVGPAEEVLALRQRVQGDKHWEAVTARVQRDTLKHVAAQPAARRQDMVRADKQLAEANRLQRRGRYAEAEPLYRQVLTIRREVMGARHPFTAASVNDLARNLYAQGKHAEAEPLFRHALDARRQALGEEYPSTAESLNNLAANLDDQGKHAEAEPLHRQALALSRKVLGPQHPATASRLGNLGNNLYHRAKYAEAESLLRQALAIKRKALGEQHSDTAVILNSLATVLDARGKYAEAEPLFRQVLAVLRQSLGEQHPYIAQSLNNLAANLYGQGKYAEAELLVRQSLAACRKALGEQHPSTALSLNNLAESLNHQSRYAEAEPLFRQALAVRRQLLGERHPATAASLYGLADSLHGQARDAEAEPLHRQALAVRRRLLGERHPATAASLNALAETLRGQGRYGEADPLYRQALAINRQALGEQSAATAESLNDLALNTQARGKYAEAEPLHRQALATYRQALGEQHANTATSVLNLAYNLTAQGKYAEAEKLLGQALARFRKSLGEQHHYTVLGLNQMAANLHARGEYAEAAKHWRDAADLSEVVRLHAAGSGFHRAVFAGQHFGPHLASAVCLARLGQPADAWRYAEAGLGRGLLDDLTTRAQLLLTPDERQALRPRLARLERLNRLLLPLLTTDNVDDAGRARRDKLVKERDVLQAELSRQAGERSRREVWSLERIQKQVPADAALVFWIDLKAAPGAADPNGEHWACVVRQKGAPAWARLRGGGDQGAWVPDDDALPRRLRDDLATGEPGWQRHARRLARQRLAPLEPHLKARDGLPAVRRLIAVPAGAMAGTPLEVLAQDYAVSYAPSASVFARLREQHRPLRDPSLLAVGDPNFNLPAAKPTPAPEHGLLLTLVLPGGNAAKAGLHSGDVLLAYGGRKLTAFADLKPATGGDPVPVQVWRDGKTFEAKLAPGKLGVAIDREPAPEALRRRRDFDALLAGRTRDKIAPLPASRYEVKALEALFARPTVLLGPEASEQQLDELAAADRLKDYRVLHFATHGEVDLGSPLRSALLLARDRLPDPAEQARQGRKVYDGRLRVATIRETWRLDADLVTLSACQTALGPSGGGDGLLGFAQVLFQKGARSLLLSLWKVDDTATALLMTRFYENLLGKRKGPKEGLPRAEALREAKAWLRALPRGERDRLAAGLVKGELRGTVVPGEPVARPAEDKGERPYAHPRYWAAFALLGDPD